jgi:hypothetical protein
LKSGRQRRCVITSATGFHYVSGCGQMPATGLNGRLRRHLSDFAISCGEFRIAAELE